MKDFKEFAEKREKKATNEEKKENVSDKRTEMNDYSTDAGQALLKALAGKYEGKSEDEIFAAILSEAQTARKNGSLTDGDIDRFVDTVSPMLSSEQRKKLLRVVKYLKSGRNY